MSARPVLGTHYPTVFLPESLRRPFVQLVDAVLAGESIQEVESPVRSRHGERRLVLWDVSRVCAIRTAG